MVVKRISQSAQTQLHALVQLRQMLRTENNCAEKGVREVIRFRSKFARIVSLFLAGIAIGFGAEASPPHINSTVAELLRDPTPAEWKDLERFDQTLTRREFETRLEKVFDPSHGLKPYLKFTGDSVAIYPTPEKTKEPLAVLRFASTESTQRSSSVPFRFPKSFRERKNIPGRPLSGLQIAIEPADIGGRWAQMEDRSVDFPGYGRINEGDINLIVGRLLREKLTELGANVFLVRDHAEPVVNLKPEQLKGLAEDVLKNRPTSLPESFRHKTATLRADSPRRLRIAEELLLTKTLETRARAALVRHSFKPDLTIVLQHNATGESSEGRLTPINRNIFFVHGAYAPSELREAEPRFRLLTKLLENTASVEVDVAAAIAGRFKLETGFPPALSGNSENTRLVLPGNPYVLARNLAFNREHDGPVVVTEPYFMNQAETLARLLAGDYFGKRRIAGKDRTSIYREYADCVASGLVDVYQSSNRSK
jgi:hypothetical protein